MQNKPFDLITFGETMALFYPDATGPLRHINGFYKYMGGAESNVSIALSRLGYHTGWFSRLGDDEFGKYIYSEVRGEGVDVSRVIFDEERATGLMFKEKFLKKNPNVHYFRKNSAASALAPADIDEDYIKQAKYLHITGITLAISETARKAAFRAAELAKRNGVLVSFDPNIRLKLWSLEEARPAILEMAKYADLIFPGQDEGEVLTGLKTPEEIAAHFMEMGSQVVAVKLGKQGCYAADRNGGCYAGPYPTEYKEDSAGAGDGFTAGFLAGQLRGYDLKTCAGIGNWIGALATLVRGDIEGYPDRWQLKGFLHKEEFIER